MWSTNPQPQDADSRGLLRSKLLVVYARLYKVLLGEYPFLCLAVNSSGLCSGRQSHQKNKLAPSMSNWHTFLALPLAKESHIRLSCLILLNKKSRPTWGSNPRP